MKREKKIKQKNDDIDIKFALDTVTSLIKIKEFDKNKVNHGNSAYFISTKIASFIDQKHKRQAKASMGITQIMLA